MKLVFDSNTIVSAALFFNSTPAIALRIAQLKYEILVSNPVIEELQDVFQREKFDAYTSIENRLNFLTDFISRTEKIHVHCIITDCRDPKDNKFLELAVEGKADYIITGDTDLLVLNPYRYISIVTPAQFLTIITAA